MVKSHNRDEVLENVGEAAKMLLRAAKQTTVEGREAYLIEALRHTSRALDKLVPMRGDNHE